MTPRLLSVKDAAAYMGRSPKAMYHLIYQHVIPTVRLGGRVMVDRQDLDALIEGNKVSA